MTRVRLFEKTDSAGGLRRIRTALVPTSGFAGFLFVLASMWYAAASQSNAASYLLLFALFSVFVVSIPHTFLNLVGLKTTIESAKPAFSGHEVSLPVEIMNESRVTRRGIAISLSGLPAVHERVDQIPAGQAVRLTLRFSAPGRGEHEIGGLFLTTVYPLGFLRMCKRLFFSQRYLVYPKPVGESSLPMDRGGTGHDQCRHEIGEGDDFAGVRDYVQGESQRHIDWKAVARGQPLMTKQFSAENEGLLYLDFAKVRSRHLEERLSQLALWVVEAERARRVYGLRLPGSDIPPSLGEAHFHRCLRALAIFK